METFRILGYTFIFTILSYCGFGQGNNTEAGLYCDPNVPNGAPVLCDLGDLDGFTARMPTMDTTILKDQPERLCRNGQGNQGDANNLSWFAFVAGSSNISFRIIPSNCTVEGNNLTGVQAGIYSRCYTWDEVVCMGDCTSSAFTIGGDLFTPGETYYFFIDGCNGSVCDYRVELLRGDQPYPLPDIDSLVFDAGSDTLCLNITTSMQTTGLIQDSIKYTYTIDPPTSEYPTGFHPDTLSSSISWTFTEVGDYEICAQADNGCDKTPFQCQMVYVRDIPNEIFSPVTICMEDLGSYRGPDLEDPNGDGTIGWQGDRFFSPGVNRDTVFLPNGCYYVQAILVEVIPLNSREDVSLIVCNEAFPFDYEGFNVVGPMENISISLDNAATSGCDSLINLTVQEIVVEADIILGECANGNGVLSLEVTNFPLAGQANTNIIWRDPNGDQLALGSNPLEQTILMSGIYEAEVIITIDTTNCNFIFQSADINLDNLVPNPPIFVDSDTILCGENMSGIYRVVSTGDPDESFNWVIPAGVTLLEQSGDSLVLDWGGVPGGEICVTITNSCGTSNSSCLSIEAFEILEPRYSGDTISCSADTLTFSFEGNNSWIYNWEIENGLRISTIDSNINGPHSLISLADVNDLRITYWAESPFCQSDTFNQLIEITTPLDTPQISCSSTENSVLFQWPEVPGAEDYQVTVIAGNSGILNGNSYLVEGLNRDDAVSIMVQAISSLNCASSNNVTFTCIAGCDPVDFSISAVDTFVCPDDESVMLNVFTTNIVDPDIQVNGPGVNNLNFFTNGLVPGIYDIIASLNHEGCEYNDTVSIEIGAYPSFVLDINQPQCEDAQEADLVFSITDGSVWYEGNILENNQIILPPGSYDFEIRGDNGCSSFENVVINSSETPTLSLPPSYTIEVGNPLNLNIVNNGFDTSRIQRVVWYNENTGEELCQGTYENCGSHSLFPNEDFTACVEIFYDNECTFILCTEVNVLQVVSIYTPQIFSPNEDGINDEFIFYTNQNDILIEGFYIFNRWGELMHARNNISIESADVFWDGNYRGKPASEGVYVYVIEYIEEGMSKIKKGDITLVR